MRLSLKRLSTHSELVPAALSRLKNSPLSTYITVAPEVQDALHRGLPVVSLESAIISHGLPYQKAIGVAKSLDSIIRAQGVVPAAIGLIDGIIKIGLEAHEVERLADSSVAHRGRWKVGRRDIAPALVKKVDGGTTVSATSFLSHIVGIDIFVTGLVVRTLLIFSGLRLCTGELGISYKQS